MIVIEVPIVTEDMIVIGEMIAIEAMIVKVEMTGVTIVTEEMIGAMIVTEEMIEDTIVTEEMIEVPIVIVVDTIVTDATIAVDTIAIGMGTIGTGEDTRTGEEMTIGAVDTMIAGETIQLRTGNQGKRQRSRMESKRRQMRNLPLQRRLTNK